VVQETARQGLAMTTLDDALDRVEPVGSPADLGVTSWGAGGDLRTWSAPAVADLAWRARAAELRLLRSPRPAGERALRELLALQASDWAFLIAREGAGAYPRERALGHAEAFDRAIGGGEGLTPALRSLAPVLAAWGN
jgi:1,4-alpha-glucan branching enzyme